MTTAANLAARAYAGVLTCAALWLLTVAPTTVAATTTLCDRTCLNGFVDQYLQALLAHDPQRLPRAAEVKFTENLIPLALGEGVWKTATSVGTYRIYAADPHTGQAGFIGILWEGTQPTMFAFRLKIVASKITEVESIVPGETVRASNLGPFIAAPAKLTTARPAYSETLPAAERSTREKMIAATTSYYQGIERSNGDIVAFADDCNRIENGVALVNNPDFTYPVMSPTGRKLPNFGAMGCREQFNTHFWETDLVTDLRPTLIDEERGIVFYFTLYHQYIRKPCADVVGYGPVCPKAKTAPFSLALVEAFRVRGGKIHEMESVWSVLSNNPLRGSW
jgi:hypothetical protein